MSAKGTEAWERESQLSLRRLHHAVPPDKKSDAVTHILLAEDNKINQTLVVRTLEKQNYKVRVANNGIEAVRAVKEGSFEVILMDVQMPEMDGFQALTAIREWERSGQLSETPIIAMTAHAMAGDRERCLKMGMSDYLSKPITPAVLLAKVDEWVSQAHNPVQML
ncbi:MAG: response regulator [Bryobacteraceae bacterium]